MRTLLMLSLFAASLAHAAWGDYEEEHELSLAAGGLQTLHIDAAAGKLTVTGARGQDDIRVVATVVVPDSDRDEAERKIEKSMELTLEQDGDSARLVSHFTSGWSWFGDSPLIHLDVTVPRHLGLAIDDSSGSIRVNGIDGDVEIDDGSGSITVRDAGANLRIDDGSGSIKISDIGMDVDVEDGSGGIDIDGVGGSVSIDDGSGSIRVENVQQNLVIIDDGSGSLSFNNIGGEVDDRS